MARGKHWMKKMFGGEFGLGNLAEDAMIVGATTAYNRAHPEMGVTDTLATGIKYVAYFFGGLLLFFIVFILIAVMFGKRTDTPPPANTTNSASGK
jgi:TRAP-type C4-dicarboxylate transport system permease small subunit